MNKIAARFVAVMVAIAAIGLCAKPVQAQNNRSFVSGHGSDSNPCTLAAPCRTFAQAVTLTNYAGEIVVLDTAGYGAVTITQSVSIVNPGGVEAGIAVSQNGTAITINAGQNDTVSLRGLTLEGAGIGYAGIAFNSGYRLEVIDCVIRGFYAYGLNATTFTNTSTSVSLAISNTVFFGTGSNGGDSAGISLRTTTVGNPPVSFIAALNQVTIDHNSVGLLIEATNGPMEVQINNSNIDNNTLSGIDLFGSNGYASYAVLVNSTVNETPTGIGVNAASAIYLSHDVIGQVQGFTNTAGIAVSGGTVFSDGTSHFNSNATPQLWSLQ